MNRCFEVAAIRGAAFARHEQRNGKPVTMEQMYEQAA